MNAAARRADGTCMTADLDHSSIRKPAFAVRVLRRIWRLATDRPYRVMVRLQWLRPRALFQPDNDTSPNRYPRVFRFVASRLDVSSDLNILSYGCSSGEEVFSLREYFPAAAIKGIDINAGSIALCRKRLKRTPDTKISFAVADATIAENTASYDAIFCMAVLRHGRLDAPNVTRCDHLIRFEDFARTVADFARCLKPGGLLVIRHSNFRLCDALAGAAFEPILAIELPETAKKSPIFGPDNELMNGVAYLDTVFQKRG
jgi:SAM-dependent methyltransferase